MTSGKSTHGSLWNWEEWRNIKSMDRNCKLNSLSMKTSMLKNNKKGEEDVANTNFVTFRQIILEKEKKAWGCNLLFVLCCNCFYITKQRGGSEQLENQNIFCSLRKLDKNSNWERSWLISSREGFKMQNIITLKSEKAHSKEFLRQNIRKS